MKNMPNTNKISVFHTHFKCAHDSVNMIAGERSKKPRYNSPAFHHVFIVILGFKTLHFQKLLSRVIWRRIEKSTHRHKGYDSDSVSIEEWEKKGSPAGWFISLLLYVC